MLKTISFEFGLDPVVRIEPWGTASDRKLHWFGLTTGWYYIRLANVELLRYFGEMPFLAPLNGTPHSVPYVDYQLARLHEDLIGLVPGSATPLPPDIAALFREKSLLRIVSEFAERAEGDDPVDPASDKLEPFFELHRDCLLDMTYIDQGQNIVFWSDGEELIVEWDSKESRQKETPPIWTAGSGSCVLRRADFIEAVGAFHDALIRQMEERVQTLERKGGLPGVQIDLTELRRDQERHATDLSGALATLPKKRDWDAVRHALRAHFPD